MSEVFLCQRGQLDNRSKSDLRKAGIVVVEVEDVSACQFIRSTEIVGSDDMLWAALDALAARGHYGNGSLNTGSDHDAKMDALARNLLQIVTDARRIERATTPEGAA